MVCGLRVMDETTLPDAEKARLGALARVKTLEDIVELTDEGTVHAAYFAAKSEWRTLMDNALPPAADGDEFPGDSINLEGHTIHGHGITHTDTQAEREFVRKHVSRYTEAGAFIYCEQGIRPMYFDDFQRVCEMDDYRWALNRCAELDGESHLETPHEVDTLLDDLHSVTDELRTSLFSLIESGSDVVGEQASQTLGDVATSYLTRHADLAIGRDYASFALSRRASEDPSQLGALQRYYRTAFLPQPVEREWLRRHDPELEVTTHARNERMADYVVHHNEEATQVHVIVGAAHQPGVSYYLRQYRTGERTGDNFELLH